ncbi:hypothetical protein ACX80S_17255 [Arthrobacter sp. RHLT1-20]
MTSIADSRVTPSWRTSMSGIRAANKYRPVKHRNHSYLPPAAGTIL